MVSLTLFSYSVIVCAFSDSLFLTLCKRSNDNKSKLNIRPANIEASVSNVEMFCEVKVNLIDTIEAMINWQKTIMIHFALLLLFEADRYLDIISLMFNIGIVKTNTTLKDIPKINQNTIEVSTKFMKSDSEITHELMKHILPFIVDCIVYWMISVIGIYITDIS